MRICITVTCAVSNVDPHTDPSLWNVLTVPFNMADAKRPYVTPFTDVNKSVNWHWSTALSAIESKKPTLATGFAIVDAKSARVEHT